MKNINLNLNDSNVSNVILQRKAKIDQVFKAIDAKILPKEQQEIKVQKQEIIEQRREERAEEKKADKAIQVEDKIIFSNKIYERAKEREYYNEFKLERYTNALERKMQEAVERAEKILQEYYKHVAVFFCLMFYFLTYSYRPSVVF